MRISANSYYHHTDHGRVKLAFVDENPTAYFEIVGESTHIDGVSLPTGMSEPLSEFIENVDPAPVDVHAPPTTLGVTANTIPTQVK